MKIPKTNWLAIGIALGTAIGVSFDNVALGIAIGTVIGALLDSWQKNDH
jgi:uncharacterized membrane protein